MRHLHTTLGEIPLLIKVGFVVMILLGGYYLFNLRTPTRSLDSITTTPSARSITATPLWQSSAATPSVRSSATAPSARSSATAPSAQSVTATLPPQSVATTPSAQSTIQTRSTSILPTFISTNNLQLDAPTAIPATALPTRPTSARTRPTRQVVTPDPTRSQYYLSVARQSVQTATNEQTAIPDDTDWHAWVIDDRTNNLPVILITMPLERSEAQSNEEFVLAAKETLLRVINTLVLDDPHITRVGAIGTFPNAEGKVLPAASLIVHKPEGQEWTPMTIDTLPQMKHVFYIRPEFYTAVE